MFYRSWFRSQLGKFVKLEEKDKTCETGVKNAQTEQAGGMSESEHARHLSQLGVVRDPADDGLEHVSLVADVQLLEGDHLLELLGAELEELLGAAGVPEVGLQVLGGQVVHVVQAVVQREVADADAVLGGDAALQELAAQRLEVRQQQQVGRLHHVLDGVLAQADLRGQHRQFTPGSVRPEPTPLI